MFFMSREKSQMVPRDQALPGRGTPIATATTHFVVPSHCVTSSCLVQRGVTVNAVAPGFIKSDMTDELPAEIVEQVIPHDAYDMDACLLRVQGCAGHETPT